MLRDKELHDMVSDLRDHVVDHYQLNQLSDEQLEDAIEDMVRERASIQGLRVIQHVELERQVFSSIRGLGNFDGIMDDPSITEVKKLC